MEQIDTPARHRSIRAHPWRGGGPLAALVLAACVAGCGGGAATDASDPSAAGSASTPDYVGVEACASCHAAEAERWTGSDHDHALEEATADTVLGDFDDTEFSYAGVTTTFFKRGAEFWVNTDGPDGELADFRVTRAIGFEPLQQYLIELPGGRLQALSIAWDTRPADRGGQRWFHLYPQDAVASDDALHWTGTYQRWNTMCAECHSTDLVKNYDAAENRFDTRFAGLDVGCEACHGPGSLHAADPAVPPPALGATERSWVFPDGASIARLADGTRGPPVFSSGGNDARSAAPGAGEIEVCAQCHSRRAQLNDDYRPGRAFLDGFRPAFLDAGLYHADGQIDGEVYVYGSFAQSAMAAAGVTCSDCHEPHSAKLRADGNALCGQCHLPTTFDTPEHHRHAAGSAGSLCVNCHMRAETYMIVDPRRDHGFRIPRPGLSARIGSPSACNDCHSDQTPEWAADRVAEWFPDGRQSEFHFGEAIHAGRTWAADRSALLRRVIEDRSEPAIARATAIGLMAEQLDDASLDLVEKSLDDPDPLVRIAGLDAVASVPPFLRADVAQRFLTDPLLAIRISAARALLPARSELSVRRQQDLDRALDEYLGVQRFNADRAEGLLNAATVAAELGRTAEAEKMYQTAIEREPAFSAAYVNLADLYRTLGREPAAESTLRAGLEVNPDDADLSFALGLSLVRLGRNDEALVELENAVKHAPDAPYYAYALGIALNSAGDGDRAVERLRAAHERFPGHRDTLFGLATILRDRGQLDEATEYAEELVDLVPGDSAARSLLDELRSTRARSD